MSIHGRLQNCCLGRIEAPRCRLRGIFPVRRTSNFISLANPAASCGQRARRLLRKATINTGLLIAIVLLSVLTGCKDNSMTDAIYDVKRQNEARLMALPGVVSVGIGQDPNGQPAIIVGLKSDDSAAARQVPSEINGYPVVIQTVGTLKAQ